MPGKLIKLKDKIFQNIFDQASEGLAILALDFNWIKVNQSFMDLLRYSDEEMYGMTINDITHKEDVQLDMNQMDDLLERRTDRYQIEKRYFQKNGTIVWVLLSVSMVVDENDKPHYFILQIMDISSIKEIEYQMNSILEIVRLQNEKLRDFAHIATHDLRTHIGNLNTISDFMEEEIAGIETHDNFLMLRGALSQLETTVTNLNEVRKKGFKSNENLKPLNLYSFVTKAIYNLNAIARHQMCHIINSIDVNVEVWGLEVYLDSIILNLLSNAIKYRSEERGSYIEISAKVKKNMVVLKIKDNGLGINMQANGSNLFKYEKTFHSNVDSRGIGLFITKNHVVNLGGRIEVESEVNVGTTFKIFLKKVDNNDQGRDLKDPDVRSINYH